MAAAEQPTTGPEDRHLGETTTLPAMHADLAMMTGNVAQVSSTDDSWNLTLAAIHSFLIPGGHVVYETRRLSDRDWERWARATTATVGPVTDDLQLPLVTFRHGYTFPSGEQIMSTSTLRLRRDQENRSVVEHAGFSLSEVREPLTGPAEKPCTSRPYPFEAPSPSSILFWHHITMILRR